MQAPQLTDWFPASTHPIRDGWYEVEMDHGEVLMAQWAKYGGDFRWCSVRRVFGVDLRRSLPGVSRWRGMTGPSSD
ncbi:hypothetical protein OPU71_06565 [Niveibacterium sp. 24ML]|uniref:hypothetical protein n=1 Tax=Niveibacterium sp. 24ML TaxID=2985512 RepID=UPI00227222D3|nr:hypothetical protein [Niveibacterium sp. 24ML]MCX9155788.1 hypothetical protein [Niveibacterium sp. 24ML]